MKQEKKPTLGFFIVVAGVAALLLPALYVLSAGPAVFLVEKRAIGQEALELAYAPLISVSDYVPECVGSRFEDYINRWRALAESTRP